MQADVAYAFRRIAREPMFAALAVVTLALGIGANAAIFSLVKTVVLVPLPYRGADRLVMLWGRVEKGGTTHLSGPEVRDYATETNTFANVAAYTEAPAILTGGPDPERVAACAVSPNIFATLGRAALVGRTFAPADDPREIADQVVLSHSLWRRRFGANRNIVNQRILVDGASTLVIGIMPATFKLPLDFNDDRPSELWRPWTSVRLSGVRGAITRS